MFPQATFPPVWQYPRGSAAGGSLKPVCLLAFHKLSANEGFHCQNSLFSQTCPHFVRYWEVPAEGAHDARGTADFVASDEYFTRWQTVFKLTRLVSRTHTSTFNREEARARQFGEAKLTETELSMTHTYIISMTYQIIHK